MGELGNERNIIQESLQPQCLNEGDRGYDSVLNIEERLRKEDATNIALTGPYGSGKSSILITLRKKFPCYNYLNISLATLKPLKSNSDSELENSESETKISELNLDRLIEYSILQQLIYREKQETLPNSRLKRIFNIPKKRVNQITISIILAILSLIIVFEPSFLVVEWLCQLFSQKKWINVVSDIIGLGYLLVFSYKAIQKIVPAICNSRLNKLNLKNGEIEFVENTSIFNKHLDEILYFFEQSPYNVVILEDLDRFETTDIFVKLRELNLLLNESKVVGRKIFFIYAVRDDMFKDIERVKCFDYISTVIPIINRSNAKNLLKKELEIRGVTDIADKYLQELGFFLHDMRLLRNIANEYAQYRGRLQTGVSSEKLLGMIVYKNYYPQDFAKLHDCNGIVYKLLNLKDKFVDTKIKELENEYKKLQAIQLSHIKERNLKESELRRIYIDAYRDKCGDNVLQFKVGDSFYSLKEIASSNTLFEKFISNSTVIYSYYVNSYYSLRTENNTLDIPFSEIEQLVDSSTNYAKRLEGLNTNYTDLEDEFYLDIQKEDIHSQTLSKIMHDIDYASNEDYASLKVPKMIEYLVLRGYIDENYYDYISYFYDNFIDAHDWGFVLDLKLNKIHPYDYHINNVEACIKEIPNSIFRSNAILKIEILDYLAKHCSDRMNMTRLKVMLRTTISSRKYDFLALYFKKGKHLDIVFTQLYEQHQDLWKDFLLNDDADQNLKLSWFKYAEGNQSCEDSQKWLSVHYDFITDNLINISVEKWSTLIQQNKYKFITLNNKSSKILETVLKVNAYEVSQHNLHILVGYLLNTTVESLSYKLVKTTKHHLLIENVAANLDQCIRTIFSTPESEKESESTILEILRSKVATEDDKILYLQNQHTKINLNIIEKIPEIKLALKCDIAEVSWENVIYYMNIVNDRSLDKELITFIENHSVELSSMLLPCNSEEDEKMLLKQLVKTDLLDFFTYKKIIKLFTKWKITGVPTIEEKRVRLLVEEGIITFNEENTHDLSNRFSNELFVYYLIKNKNKFLKLADSLEYTTEVAIGLLQSDLSIKEKKSLIQYFDIDIVNEPLADNIINILTKEDINLDTNFLLKVMRLTKLFSNRLYVLNNTLEKHNFKEDIITAYLESLEEPYKSIAEKGKKPELPECENSRKLISLLKKYNYISSYSNTKKGIRVYTKFK